MDDQFVLCEMSDLPRYSCAHCRKVEEPSPTEGIALSGRPFPSVYRGVCVLCDHTINRGTQIFRPVHADNPFLPMQGYGCEVCLHEIKSRR